MTLLARGIRKKCPRCGAGKLFERWFRMKDRCPSCGWRFERKDEGFFLGAFTINFAVAEGMLGLALAGLIVRVAAGVGPSLQVWIAIAVALQLVVPIFFYPFSKTIWASIEMAAHSPEPAEEAEAIAAHASKRSA